MQQLAESAGLRRDVARLSQVDSNWCISTQPPTGDSGNV